MHCCDSYDYMSTTKGITQLIGVCSKEQLSSFDKRQIPINIDENLIMKLQIDDKCITCNHHEINKQNKIYQTFIKTYKKLTIEQLQNTLCVSICQIKEYIPRYISCLGCRTSIDNFIKTIIEYRHQALEPIIINENNLFTLKKSHYSCPDYIYKLFYTHGSKLNSFIESIRKSKKNHRCHIHSLDKIKSIYDWQIVWNMMNKECRDEITLVESNHLLDSLENYLHKNRFCSECKLKVLEAYDLLLDNHDQKRKGFCPELYQGLRSCSNDKHIHIEGDKDFIESLILRAELEIEDNRRERHAKTLDIAQEEILTCIGIYLYEKFEKIYRTIRSEEQTWQLLFYIIIDCLRLNFEMITEDFPMTLKNLCEEFSDKDQNKKQKTIKKKSQRQKKIKKNIQQEKQIKTLQSLIKSQSYPSLSIIEQNIPLSSSLETLFSSVSTRDCVCHEKQLTSCEECLTLSCIRCSSTRTDLGYSSELDDASSSGPCEYSSTTCVSCLNDSCSQSVLSNNICNCTKTIELCDITRKPKLKLQLSEQYPFFNMDLKQTWDETLPTILENTSFISDDDLREFFVLHTQFEMKRAQLREIFKLNFQIWQQQINF